VNSFGLFNAILIVIGLFFSSSFENVQAAETPMLERTITIAIKGERIDAALKRISQQGNFTFSYNPGIIDVSRIVTINFSNKTIREVLDELFNGEIDYKERKKYVILTKAKKRSSDSKVFSGYILDEATGNKLSDVTIYDPASLSSAITNEYGFFEIRINKPSPDLILTVNKTNYTDTVVAVPTKRGLLKIQIKNSKERIVSATDSVRIKLKRFIKKQFLSIQKTSMINVDDTIYRTRQVSLLPFIGTNHKLSGNVINDYSFNIYGGYSLGVRKLEMSGLFSIVAGDVTGTQLACAFNGVQGKTKGLQMAGGINANYDSTQGAQFAGLINLNWNSVQKFAAAGLLNVTYHDSRGVIVAGLGNATLGKQRGPHIAGLFNFSTQETGPLQLAGLLNFTAGKMRGVQTAGLINFSARDLKGAQVGGVINFVADTLIGAQVSGLFNYATHIKGVQLGLINVSKNIKGVPVGLFSFSLKGYHTIEVSTDEIFYTNVAFRTGVRLFYNIITAGIKPNDSPHAQWSVGYGIGTMPRLTKWLSLNLDLTTNQLSSGNFTEAVNLNNKAFLGVEIQPYKKFAFTVGITLNTYITDTTYHAADIFTDYKPSIFYDRTHSNDINTKMWLGAKVGLRFL
jgi:hypothetical protein